MRNENENDFNEPVNGKDKKDIQSSEEINGLNTEAKDTPDGKNSPHKEDSGLSAEKSPQFPEKPEFHDDKAINTESSESLSGKNSQYNDFNGFSDEANVKDTQTTGFPEGKDDKTDITQAVNAGNTENPSVRETFRKAFEWIEIFALYFSVGLLLILLLFRHSPVVGSSMYPTLSNGDILIVREFLYSPKSGDIIVCQSESYGMEKPLVKRVIATGGQKVSINYGDWTVTVDGEKLSEEYVNYPMDSNGNLTENMDISDYLDEEFTVPEGYIFVMGDNRNASLDSRFAEVGFIDERMVLGKVCLRIMPLNKITAF